MATESIGSLIPTAIPGYADAADIQAALRAYHYGSYTYDPANTSTAQLVNPSIAWTINDLQDQIDNISGDGIPASIFAAKGDLLSASANDTPLIISSGSNGQFLVVNTTTATGLQWSNTLTSPVVSGLALSDSSIVFEGSVADNFETTLTIVNPTDDRTVTIPDDSGTIAYRDLTLNAQTGTTYTTVLADNSKLITLTNSSPITVTVPLNSSVAYPIGAQINLTQLGTGQVSVAGTSGVTVNATPGLKLREQYSAATIIKIDTNAWLLTGDLSA